MRCIEMSSLPHPEASLPRVWPLVSVIIPARNEEPRIGALVRAVRAQAPPPVELEVIVVDDGSTDASAAEARAAGARVIELGARQGGGNPAVARNHGARKSRGDPLVFLDADCFPEPGWLSSFLDAHAAGEVAVGGSLELPADLPVMARCDYYCGWYHVHARRRAAYVANHPPGNLSVRRAAFLATSGFTERQPIAYAHEELALQSELAHAGYRLRFEPRARVVHQNRPGLANLLRRNYRWAYSSIESKADTGAARMAWMYRYPRTLMAASVPLAFVQTAYILGCWTRARRFEPLALAPVVLAARLAYAAGTIAGGIRWLHRAGIGSRSTGAELAESRPRWE
jgi:mycofactocin glycosyltransferase